MSKKMTKLYILLGVLAVVCLAIWGVSKYEEHRDTVKAEQQQIISVKADDVKKLSWTTDSNTLSFYRNDDGTWMYSGDDSFPVDQDKINDCLSLFEDFGSAFIIEDVEDYSQYGLENSENVIRFSTDDKDYCITLGDFSKLDEKRYISIDDGKVYLANDDPADTFDKTLEQVIKNDEIPDFDGADEIEFEGNYSYRIQHLKDQKSICEDDEYFVRESSTYKPVDTSRLNSYLSSLTNVSLDSYVTYNVTDEELSEYGLDNPELTASITYTETDDDKTETSKIFIFSVSENPEELAAKKAQDEEAAANEEIIEDEDEIEVTKYLRINDSKIVYKLSESDYDSLMAGTYDDLRHQELFTADFDKATSIDITLDGETYTLSYGAPVEEESEDAEKSEDKDKDEEKKEDKWYHGSEEIEISSVKSELQALSADSFTNDAADGKEEISVTVHLDDETYSSIKIDLYRHDGDLCLAKVDNISVAYVTRQSVVNLIEAVNAIVL